MHRRPFIKQLGSSLTAIPLLAGGNDFFSGKGEWKDWLKQFVKACGVEPVFADLYFHEHPEAPMPVQSGEFRKANAFLYLYGNGKFCFRVYEKYHKEAGLLSLMIPFWKRQTDGRWSKIACISQYELEALARASQHFGEDADLHLLPVQSLPSGGFVSRKGSVTIMARLESGNAVKTSATIMHQDNLAWSLDFRATPLPYA